MLKTARREALKSLNSTLPLMSYMDIRFISEDDLAGVKGCLVSAEVVSWVNKLSTLMVINRVSRKVAEYWGTLKIRGINNSALFSQRSRKTIRELLDKNLKRYTAVFRESKSNPTLFISDFLSREYYSPSDLGSINKLKVAIDTLDLYSFFESVYELHNKIKYPAATFSKIKEMFSKYAEEASRFMQVTDGSLKDWYVYTYSNLFSEEEIVAGIAEVKERIKRPFLLKRLEGETFQDYLSRLSVAEFDASTCDLDPTAKFFRDLYGYIPSIYSLYEFYSYLNRPKDSDMYRVLMNDLIMYSFLFGEKCMYEFLGLYPNEKVLSVQGRKLEQEDSDKYKCELIMSNLIYPSFELNTLVADKNSSVGEGEEYRSIIDYAMNETEEYLEQLKYLPEIRRYLCEHYLDRVDETSDR
jgi:hypothetical protein